MREKERKHNFDRGKVEALNREASREDGTIGSSPCHSVQEKRDSLSARDSAFSVERIFPPLHHGYNRMSYVVLYLLLLCRAKNLTNGLLPACVPEARSKSLHFIRDAISLEEIFAHLSHRRNQFTLSMQQNDSGRKKLEYKKTEC